MLQNIVTDTYLYMCEIQRLGIQVSIRVDGKKGAKLIRSLSLHSWIIFFSTLVL